MTLKDCLFLFIKNYIYTYVKRLNIKKYIKKHCKKHLNFNWSILFKKLHIYNIYVFDKMLKEKCQCFYCSWFHAFIMHLISLFHFFFFASLT